MLARLTSHTTVALLMLAGTGGDDTAGRTTIPDGPAGFWRGQSVTVRTSAIGVKPGARPLVNLTRRYESEFWFTLLENGRLDGTAVVRYRMELDDDRLRGIAAYVNGATNTAIGQFVPLLSGVIGTAASVKDLIGMRAEYDEGEPVRRGRITGQLRGRTLHIEWASPPNELTYTVSRVYVVKDEVQSSSRGPAYAPWTIDGEVTEVAAGEWQAEPPHGRLSGEKGQTQWTSYWFAARSTSGVGR